MGIAITIIYIITVLGIIAATVITVALYVTFTRSEKGGSGVRQTLHWPFVIFVYGLFGVAPLIIQMGEHAVISMLPFVVVASIFVIIGILLVVFILHKLIETKEQESELSAPMTSDIKHIYHPPKIKKSRPDLMPSSILDEEESIGTERFLESSALKPIVRKRKGVYYVFNREKGELIQKISFGFFILFVIIYMTIHVIVSLRTIDEDNYMNQASSNEHTNVNTYTSTPEPLASTPEPIPISTPEPTPEPTQEPIPEPTPPGIRTFSRPLDTASASWDLYYDGTLVVNSGNIRWNHWWSPWSDYRNYISRIVFTGPITVIGSTRGFFHDLHYVTSIEGLWHFSSDDAWYMSWVFRGVSNLTTLDLSGWDTSNWGYMRGMFENASSLASLNLSGWDTYNVRMMDNMFYGTASLRQLTLGENFRFVNHYQYGNASLPNPPENTTYTGRWTNGTHSFTADELMTNPLHSLKGTWVWERR